MDNKDIGKKKEKKDVKKAADLRLEERIKDLENQLARAIADYRNLEKRVEDERRETIKYANRELLIRVIPAFDTLFLAEKYTEDEGIKLTVRHLADTLRTVGVEKVEALNEQFNPETMEAVATGQGEENMVLEELKPGFLLNGKTIRPAQVKVGKKSEEL